MKPPDSHRSIIAERFQVCQIAGSGGAGTVYICRDESGTDVAVKEIQGNPDAVNLEIRALVRLKHPGIIEFIEGLIDQGHAYIVMELVRDARTLREYLDQQGVPGTPLRLNALHSAIAQILDALDYLHGRGVVHGDLKPQNILVTADGRIKIADFGLAHIHTDAHEATATLFFAGTANYASPEQCRGAFPDARSDLYSLGVVLYEAYTGHLPFQGGTFYEILLKHIQEKPRSLPLASSGVPAPMERTIMLLLEKNPADRPLSARDTARHCRLDDSIMSRQKGSDDAALLPPAFTGRLMDLSNLERLIDDHSAEPIRSAVIESAQGFGKSRLIREFDLQHAWRGIVCLPIAAPGPGQTLDVLFVAVLRRVLNIMDRMTGTQSDTLRHQVSPVLASLGAEFQRLINPDASVVQLPDAFLRVLSNLALVQTTVILIDDSDLLDEATSQLIGRIIDSVIGIRFLVTRTSESQAAVAERLIERLPQPMTRLTLAPLSDANLTTMIQSMLGTTDVPPGLLAALLPESKGNPAAVEEITRWEHENGALYLDGNQWVYEPDSRLSQTGRIGRAALDRCTRLHASDRHLLDAASVAFPLSDREVIRSVSHLSEELFLDAALRLRQSGFVEIDARGVHFRQRVLREVLYASISSDARAVMHDAVALWMRDHMPNDDALSAFHLGRGTHPQTALGHYLAAIEHLMKQARFTEVVRTAETAIAIDASEPEQKALIRKMLKHLGAARRELGELTHAQDAFQKLRELSRDDLDAEMELHALYGLSGILFSRGHTEAALISFEDAILLCESTGNTALEARCRMGAGVCRFSLGEYAPAIDHARRAGELFKTLNYPNSMARSNQLLGDCCLELGEYRQAMSHYTSARDLFQKQKQTIHEASCIASIGRCLLDQGNNSQAEACMQQAIEIALKAKHPMIENLVRINLGSSLLMRGEPFRAIRELECATDAMRRIGFPKGIADALRNLAKAYESVGDSISAESGFAEAMAIYSDLKDEIAGLQCSLDMAEAYIQRNRLTDAHVLIRRTLRTALRRKHRLTVANAYRLSARILEMQGEFARAKRAVEKSNRVVSGLNLTMFEASSSCQSAFLDLRLNQITQAESQIKSLYRIFDECGMLNWKLRTMCGLCEIAVVSGDRSRADELAQQIRKLIQEMGDFAAIPHLFFRKSPNRYPEPASGVISNLARLVIASDQFKGSFTAACAAAFLAIPEPIAIEHTIPSNNRSLPPSLSEGCTVTDGRTVRMKKIPDTGPIRFLVRSIRKLLSAQDLDRLLLAALDQVIEATEAERGFLMLRNESGEFRFHISRNLNQEDITNPEFETSRSIIQRVIETGKTYLSADAASEEAFLEQKSIQSLGLRSVLCAAIPSHDGKAQNEGLIYVDNLLERGLFYEADRVLVETVGEISAIALNAVRERQELSETKQILDEENLRLKKELGKRYQFGSLVGSSASMSRIFTLIERVAPSMATVLITGETGTGKEMAARTIHFNSSRKSKVFIGINCSTLPENLLESELFGIERGVATGVDARIGLIQKADGGTLFLDEIADMNVAIQSKLLRMLQEREITPLGARTPRKVDVRIIAATNKDLKLEMKEGRFREDLFYRINVIHIELPPLRNRREDIPRLAQHFLEKYSKESNVEFKGINRDAMARLAGYEWPGNVRELENVIQRAVILETGKWITEVSLSPDLGGGSAAQISADESSVCIDRAKIQGFDLKENIDRVERIMIDRALDSAHGVKQDAAKLLGISPRIMSYYLKKHDMGGRKLQEV